MPVDCSAQLNYYVCRYETLNSNMLCWNWYTTVHVLMWPQQYRAIWLQRAWHWCNYTSVGFLSSFHPYFPFLPYKMFTQVSHNHSVTGVDTTYTQLTTPPESSILFYSKDVVKIHLYVVFGSSVCQDARMSGRFLVSSSLLYTEAHPII